MYLAGSHQNSSEASNINKMSGRDKETIVFVVNVGSTGDPDSHKEFVGNAKDVMRKIIEKKIFLEPRDEVGIVLMGVEVGVNALQYDNIEDYHQIQVCSWDMLEKVLDIVPMNCSFTNWIPGIRAGVDLMQREAGDSKRKTVVVMMDCPDAEINQDEMKKIAADILDEEIALLWIGTSPILALGREGRNTSQKMVQRLSRRVDGKYATFPELLPNLRFYGGKQPKATGWRCNLEICDIQIPTMTYPYITKNTPLPPWKGVAQHPESENPNEFKKVAKAQILADYHKKEYEKQDIIRGYKYGGQFVPMTDELMADLKEINTEKSLILYGFIPKEKVKLRDRCGIETHILLPVDGVGTHFCSLIKAMNELNVVAIVRRVYTDKCEPKMKILYPQTDDPDKPWCCFMIDFMFKENHALIEPRTYREVYNRMKDDEWSAIDDLIDNMMLKDPTCEDVDQRTFVPGTIPKPDIQFVWDRLAHRALNPLIPDEEPPPHSPADDLIELISMPKYLQTRDLDRCIERVVELFELNREAEVEIPVVATEKTSSTDRKFDESGYSTQSSIQNTPATQMDVDLDALI